MRPVRWVQVSVMCSAAGCMEYSASRLHGADTFEQYPAAKVDVLLVVDNSSSMGPYQTQLSANFGQFISWFVQGNVDYHIGITTTDGGNDARVENPARGRFVGPVITSDMDMETAEALYGEQVQVGTDGSGLEVGLKTAHLALTDHENLGEQIDAFLREDAALSIVFVSDEEDSSPWPVNEYVNAFFDLKGQRDRAVFNASALTVTDESTCSEEGARFSSPGSRYVDVAIQTHGLTANLCDMDFSQIVGDLSLATSRMLQTFMLSDEPDAATIEVVLEADGVETVLPCDSGEWVYSRSVQGEVDQPAITFDLEHLPPPDSRIHVRYLLGDGNPVTFCGGAS